MLSFIKYEIKFWYTVASCWIFSVNYPLFCFLTVLEMLMYEFTHRWAKKRFQGISPESNWPYASRIAECHNIYTPSALRSIPKFHVPNRTGFIFWCYSILFFYFNRSQPLPCMNVEFVLFYNASKISIISNTEPLFYVLSKPAHQTVIGAWR